MHGRVKVKTTAEQEEEKRKEREQKLKKYRAATARVVEKRKKNEFDDELLDITALILQGNPDYTTMWNLRRETFAANFEHGCKRTAEYGAGELLLTEAALQKNPKSYGAWSHRAWAMETFPDMDWHKELQLCKIFLERDDRNFHCWDYRRFLCKHAKVTAERELAFTLDQIAANFSNYSAWHYRSSLLPTVHPGPKEGTVLESTLLEEYSLVQNATFTDPGDQSAWFYHRWLTGRERSALDFLLFYVSKETCRIIVHLTKQISLADTQITILLNNSPLVLKWMSPGQSFFSALWTAHFREGSLLPGDCTLTAVVNCKDGQTASVDLFIAEAQRENKTMGNIPRSELFSGELSAARTSVLAGELETCRRLHALEPNNKWPLLTCVLLMKALDGRRYRAEIRQFLAELEAVDPMRRKYYSDLSAKFATESVIEQLSEEDWKVDFSNLGLTSVRHAEHLSLMQEVNLSSNRITSARPLVYLLSVRRLTLDDNRLKSCEGLDALPLLVFLSLRDNKIEDEGGLDALKDCPMLSELNLEGNPISESKINVQRVLPQVKYLDGSLL